MNKAKLFRNIIHYILLAKSLCLILISALPIIVGEG